MWLVKNIADAEVEEMANKLTLAGGDGEKFREEVYASSEVVVKDYSVDKDVDLYAVTKKLRGGYGTRNS